jgi:hypothetical protein
VAFQACLLATEIFVGIYWFDDHTDAHKVYIWRFRVSSRASSGEIPQKKTAFPKLDHLTKRFHGQVVKQYKRRSKPNRRLNETATMKIHSSVLTSICLLQVGSIAALMQEGNLRQAKKEKDTAANYPLPVTKMQNQYHVHTAEERRRTVQQRTLPSLEASAATTTSHNENSERHLQNYDGSYGDCSEDYIYVNVEVLADWYANETTWQVTRDSDGMIIQSGYGLMSSQYYTSSFCLPKNCYTFTINDSKGDGICCDYGLGKYNVTTGTYDAVNYMYNMDTVVISGGQFGASESAQFGGECQPLPDYPKTKCVNLTVSMTTGEDPWNTWFSLYDLNSMTPGSNFWTDYAELPNSEYTFTKCIDPGTCYEFGMTSYVLDGSNATDITVTYDGAAVDFVPGENNLFSALIGGACAGRPPCVDLTFSLYTEDTEYDLQISLNDYVGGSYQSFYDGEEQLYEFTKCVDPLRCYEVTVWACYNDTSGGSYCSTSLSEFEDVLTYNGTTMPTNFSYTPYYYVGEACSKFGYNNNNYW